MMLTIFSHERSLYFYDPIIQVVVCTFIKFSLRLNLHYKFRKTLHKGHKMIRETRTLHFGELSNFHHVLFIINWFNAEVKIVSIILNEKLLLCI